MKLTEQEARWLNLWEKRQRLWPVTRWVCLLIAMFSAGCGIFIFDKIVTDDLPEHWALTLMFIPFFFFGMAGMWFGLVLSKWQGDLKFKLLLRLIREHTEKDT